MQPVGREQLGTEDVADTRDHALIHQRLTDADSAPLQRGPTPLRIGVRPQRVRAEAADDGRLVVAGHQFAGGGTGQVDGTGVVGETHADVGPGLRRWNAVVAEPAEQAQVDVDRRGVVVAVEQVLAVGLGADEAVAVDRGGALEASLGRGHRGGAAGEPRGVLACEAVHGVTLGHASVAAAGVWCGPGQVRPPGSR